MYLKGFAPEDLRRTKLNGIDLTKMKDFLEIHDFHGLNEIKRTMVFWDLKHPNQPEDLKTL